MKKIMINIKNHSAMTFKKNDVLLFDEKDKAFYVMTKEELFSDLTKKFQETITETEKKFQDLSNSYNQFILVYEQDHKKLTDTYREFLAQYTEQNTKVINLVESFTKKD